MDTITNGLIEVITALVKEGGWMAFWIVISIQIMSLVKYVSGWIIGIYIVKIVSETLKSIVGVREVKKDDK